MSKRTKLDTVGLQWPSKQVETLGERKFRDIVGILPRPGHLRDKAKNPGLSRPFRDGWQLWATVAAEYAYIVSAPRVTGSPFALGSVYEFMDFDLRPPVFFRRKEA